MLIDTKKPVTLFIMFLMGGSALASLATAPLLAIGGLDNFVAANVFLIISAACFGLSIILWATGLKKIEDASKTRTDADKMFLLLFFITIVLFVVAVIAVNL